jgi:hypothetical protein
MKALREGHKGLRLAFEHNSIGATMYENKEIPEYLGAFHPGTSTDIRDLKKVIETGAELFRLNCGYSPTHFISPNKESPTQLDRTLQMNGVRYLTMSKIRHYSVGDGKYRTELNWLGRKNKLGQIIITRNCIFDPVSDQGKDWVNSCLKEIDISFKWNKPAVVNTHRVNYVGHISNSNSDLGLRELNRLLSEIMKRWPETEFMTSTELGEAISSHN